MPTKKYTKGDIQKSCVYILISVVNKIAKKGIITHAQAHMPRKAPNTTYKTSATNALINAL